MSKSKLIVVVLLMIVSYFIGSILQKKKFQVVSEKAQLEFSNTLKSKDKRIENLSLCIENRASILETYTEPYSYKTFAIDSPILVNSEVSVTKYEYCNYTVFEKFIDLDEMRVFLTYIEDNNQYGKHFSNKLLGENNFLRDIPIFHGYENYTLQASFVSEIAKDWSKKESYTNKNNIQFFYKENYEPRILNSVNAQFYSSFSVLSSAIFIDVLHTVDYSNLANFDSATEIKDAKQKINVFLESISLGF